MRSSRRARYRERQRQLSAEGGQPRSKRDKVAQELKEALEQESAFTYRMIDLRREYGDMDSANEMVVSQNAKYKRWFRETFGKWLH